MELRKFMKALLEIFCFPKCRNKSHNVDQKMLDFYKGFIKPGNLCFDIGANIGERSDIFLKLGAKVICIEPQRDCIKVLRSKYMCNSNVKIMGIGLASQPGTITLSICKNANTISTFSEKWKSGRFSSYQWDEQYDVPVVTLDKIVKKYGVPDFCKIDVEGFEFEVLKGLSSPIRLLSFEFTCEFIHDAQKCIQYLESLGKVEFNFALGDNLKSAPCLEIDNWVSGERLFREIDAIPVPLLWGDIYARFLR